MTGHVVDASWELLQDVQTAQQFIVGDLILSMQQFEEDKFVNGSGSGEALGLLGNVSSPGELYEPDSNSNLVTVAGTLSLTGALKGAYHKNASWLMSRATSIVIRKSQTQANLFNPAWTRENGQDYLHGYPVFYSSSMPAASRGNTPALFGDFSAGYIVGDRGGSGISIKILDQPKAVSGITSLLAYRRVDGRVRLAEAIVPYKIALS